MGLGVVERERERERKRKPREEDLTLDTCLPCLGRFKKFDGRSVLLLQSYRGVWHHSTRRKRRRRRKRRKRSACWGGGRAVDTRL